MKNTITIGAGVLGAVVSTALGGWDTAIITLLVFMGADYILGLISGIMQKSTKTTSGGLSSAVGFRGLLKKGSILIMVVVGTYLDKMLGFSYIRDAICMTYILNELISITENLGLIGVPLPKVVTKIIEALNKKGEDENEN